MKKIITERFPIRIPVSVLVVLYEQIQCSVNFEDSVNRYIAYCFTYLCVLMNFGLYDLAT